MVTRPAPRTQTAAAGSAEDDSEDRMTGSSGPVVCCCHEVPFSVIAGDIDRAIDMGIIASFLRSIGRRRPYRPHSRHPTGNALQPVETIEVDNRTVDCDGGSLAHPRVFLNMGNDKEVDCPYCGRRFVLKAGAQSSR